MNQGTFAKTFNLSAGYISQLERCTKQPKSRTLALLNVIRRKGLEAIF
jgi:DNA-binding transcriptional regulator YiaG